MVVTALQCHGGSTNSSNCVLGFIVIKLQKSSVECKGQESYWGKMANLNHCHSVANCSSW